MQVLVSGQIPLEIEIGDVDSTVSEEMTFSSDVALHSVGFQFFYSETLLLTTRGNNSSGQVQQALWVKRLLRSALSSCVGILLWLSLS